VNIDETECRIKGSHLYSKLKGQRSKFTSVKIMFVQTQTLACIDGFKSNLIEVRVKESNRNYKRCGQTRRCYVCISTSIACGDRDTAFNSRL